MALENMLASEPDWLEEEETRGETAEVLAGGGRWLVRLKPGRKDSNVIQSLTLNLFLARQ